MMVPIWIFFEEGQLLHKSNTLVGCISSLKPLALMLLKKFIYCTYSISWGLLGVANLMTEYKTEFYITNNVSVSHFKNTFVNVYVWKISIQFSNFYFNLQISLLKRKTVAMCVLYNFNLVSKDSSELRNLFLCCMQTLIFSYS